MSSTLPPDRPIGGAPDGGARDGATPDGGAPGGGTPDGCTPCDGSTPGVGANGKRLTAYLRAGEVVDAFAAGRLQRAALEAEELRTLAGAKPGALDGETARSADRVRRREIARRSLVAELATSTLLSEWTVTRLLSEAADLCERFSAGVDALAAGVISRQHLSVIHDAGALIVDDVARAEFLQAALARARETTPGRLAPIVRVLADRYLEHSLDERHELANERRDVEVSDLADGMAALIATLPATLAHGILDRLTQQARSVIDARAAGEGDAADAPTRTDVLPGFAGLPGLPGLPALADTDAVADTAIDTDARTMAQLRADILTDVLLTASPDECVAGVGLDAIRATVQVTIPVLTMTGHGDEPCLLAGYGPIDTQTARELAGAATGWERVMTSPSTGQVLSVDRYRPNSQLKRFLRARDERCRFPGCRKAVWRCDIDHTIDAALGGPTDATNLAHFCRRHHILKHNSPWTVRQLSAGVLEWTSPSGRKHTDTPEPVVRFTPDDDLLARRRFIREPWLHPPGGPPDGPRAPF